ncbi:hypothetical protein HYH03_011663 [Edaphochlamys debaryana]|uniref:Uncharacterized protein n=1 Tax=Edaphochlamys debaryana TaxID=47281 RepID=A0A835XRJ5_9CHLO|nr:hypothetical protein HYH03_011660 [Edaphochlamys debaryana]KAG2489861.1 hypothetical protein HYH03_011663 [Edaphochlamys debaryana]|eukprot:KAG2489857.1 hypothetical protein HYH03_011660 [Edaphochlamys debaryana]
MTCADVITSLAPYDYLLGENPSDTRLARLNQKLALAPAVQDAAGYAGVFQYIKSKGTGFSCGFTQNWAGEVFEGLEGQYPYMLAGGTGDNKAPNTAAEYKAYYGDEVTALFKEYASSSKSYIFYIYHGAAADHVLLVEQLANQQGYRVYQSYNSVYSLKAWLEPGNTDTLAALWGPDPSKGHLIPNNKLYGIIDNIITTTFNGTFSAANPPPITLVGPDFHAFITYWLNQATNKTQIVDDVYKSKVKYGGGRIIPQAEFHEGYVATFNKLTAWYKDNLVAGGNARMPQDIFDAWTDLYGSPNPVVGAGLPINIVAEIQLPYFMQIKVVETTGADCWRNAKGLYASLNKPY